MEGSWLLSDPSTPERAGNAMLLDNRSHVEPPMSYCATAALDVIATSSLCYCEYAPYSIMRLVNMQPSQRLATHNQSRRPRAVISTRPGGSFHAASAVETAEGKREPPST